MLPEFQWALMPYVNCKNFYWKFADVLYFFDYDAAVFMSTRRNFFDDDTSDLTSTTSQCFFSTTSYTKCTRMTKRKTLRWMIAEHVHNVISSCAQALHALRVLRAHGMDDASLQTICWLVIIAKLTWASSVWWGYTSATDWQRLEAFIKPRSRFPARSANATTSVHALHSNKVEKHQKMYLNCWNIQTLKSGEWNKLCYQNSGWMLLVFLHTVLWKYKQHHQKVAKF